MQSQKHKKWETKDVVITMLMFTAHIVVVLGFCLLTIFLNTKGKQGFLDYFNTRETVIDFSNLVIEMIIITAVLYVYFSFEHSDFLIRRRNAGLILVILELSLVANYFIGKYLSIYARPVAFVALLSLYLINRRSSIFMNIVMSLMIFIVDMFTASDIPLSSIYSQLILNFTAGVIAVYVLDGVTSRVKIFFSGIIIALPVLICVMGLEYATELKDNIKILIYCVSSGMLSVVLMMVVLPFLELMFNVVTDFRLSEITDINSKVIKSLRENAPGTFNHSLTVATLAETCAAAIGENVLLARAAAYYHDIGKLKQPEYYAENQQGYNPHDELSPELSTDIIRSHARVGAEFIKERNLPEFLADVASQHHGTLPIKYFFAKAKKYTESELDIKDFSYAGPKPQSKIAAIIMICDASEAKVRTMTDRAVEKVDKAVKDIIEERMDLEQFTDCDITLKELEIIRSSIVITLAGVYHNRVKYPKLKVTKGSQDDKNNG